MSDASSLDPDIAGHYALGLESARVTVGDGRLEWLRTWEILGRFLPPAPAVVIDIGGGTGPYAVPLSERGYSVHLLDPVARHVEEARAAGTLAGAAVGDARALPFDDESADAALLLGPLYHLIERVDRLTALREARRALRPGGVLAAAAISRFASNTDGLRQGFLLEDGFEPMVERLLRDGVHAPPGRSDWFTTAYFHRPGELADEVRDAGLGLEALLAVEGPGWKLPDLGAWLDDPERREVLMRALRRVEAEPSMLGASSHLLAVARR